MARPQEFNTDEALSKAMGVFWLKGYEATSLADLLEATGLSKSSLYATFGGKHELFLTAFDTYRAERRREIQRVLGTGPAREAIETFFRMIIGDKLLAKSSHGCMNTNQAVEMAPRDPEIRSRVEDSLASLENAFAETIKRGQKEGSVKSPAAARELARHLLVLLMGFQVIVRAGVDNGRLKDALKILLANLD